MEHKTWKEPVLCSMLHVIYFLTLHSKYNRYHYRPLVRFLEKALGHLVGEDALQVVKVYRVHAGGIRFYRRSDEFAHRPQQAL